MSPYMVACFVRTSNTDHTNIYRNIGMKRLKSSTDTKVYPSAQTIIIKQQKTIAENFKLKETAYTSSMLISKTYV